MKGMIIVGSRVLKRMEKDSWPIITSRQLWYVYYFIFMCYLLFCARIARRHVVDMGKILLLLIYENYD